MKAYQLLDVNRLEYVDVNEPELNDNWVLVRVKSAGICSSDIPRIFKKGTYHFPTIPGHEFSGIVERVKSNADQKWLGKKVGVFPLIPCKTCLQCQKHHYELCQNYDYIGSRRDGAFAEFVAVPVWNLVELPKDVSFDEAALLEPLAVALHAVKAGKIDGYSNVAIIGTGLIGLAAAQWANALHAKEVFVIGRNEYKRNLVNKLSNVEYLSYSDQMEKHFDIIIEAVGSSESLEKAIELADSDCRIVLMGNPNGDICLKQDIYWKILRKQLTIVGIWNSTYESEVMSDWTEVCQALAEKKLNIAPLITHRYKQENLMDGLNLMYQHKAPYCKVITLWNQ